MSKQFLLPKFAMGSIETIGPDGEAGIPYDEAVIHIDGDEDSEIEVHCPGALRLAPMIVTAVNSHDELLELAKLFRKSVEYEIRVNRTDAGRDEEGARLKTITLNLIRDAIAKAERGG